MVLETTYASRNIGDVFFTLRLDNTLNGAVPADGKEYNASDFEQDELKNPYSLCVNNRIANVDYATYESQIKNNGCCAYFGIDTLNGKFRVPTMKDVFIEAGDSSTLAQYLAPQLPNIKATFQVTNNWPTKAYGDGTASPNASGAVSVTGRWGTNSAGNGGTGAVGVDFDFNASRSSSLYKDGATVQPKAIKLRPFVQLMSIGASSEDSSDEPIIPPDSLKVPYIFVPGTEAKALEVNANFDYVLRAIENADTAPVVHLGNTETITGKKTFTQPTSMNCIELIPPTTATHGGYIDFHYAGSTSDYTARLTESTKGYLAINQDPPSNDASTKIATTNWTTQKLNQMATLIKGLAPNWSKPEAIASGYVAKKPEWVVWHMAQRGLYAGWYFTVNDQQVGFGFNTYGDRTGGGNATVLISEGDVVKFSGGWCTKYPCKGL